MPGPYSAGPGPQPQGDGGSGGGGSTTTSVELETPTGAVNGVNTDFVFVGTPVLVMDNGIPQSPDAYSILGTTVSITVPPEIGHQITGLTTT